MRFERLERFLTKAVVPQKDSDLPPVWKKKDEFRNALVPDNLALPFSPEFQIDLEETRFGHYCAVVALKAKDRQTLAVKIHRPLSSQELTLPAAAVDRKQYERLKKGPLGPHLAETHFLIGQLGQGEQARAVQINVQPWMEGQRVGEIKLKDILKDLHLLHALDGFSVNLLRCYIQMGENVDYCGSLKIQEGFLGTLEHFLRYSIFSSTNIFWDGKRLFLADVTTHIGIVQLKEKLIQLLVRPAMAVRDYLVIETALKVAKGSIPQEVAINEHTRCLKEIVARLEELRQKYGLEYRVVGGVGAAALLDKRLGPWSSERVKRDIDVMILNPSSCPEELDSLEQWAKEQEMINIFFPLPTIIRVPPRPPAEVPRAHNLKEWISLFFRKATFYLDGNGAIIKYDQVGFPLPSEALEPTTIEWQGTKFQTFPAWVHYFLYLTRNGGVVKSRDAGKVEKLKEAALAHPLGQAHLPKITRFVNQVNRQYYFRKLVHSGAMEMHWWLRKMFF